MRSSVLESKSVALADLFSLVRQREMSYGGKEYGLPLYTQMPLHCAGRTTRIRAAAGSSRRPGGATMWTPPGLPGDDRGVALIEPTAEPWLAVMLVLRAAAYSEMDDRAELLFDSESMAPRLLTPPVVRGLSEMKTLHEGAVPSGDVLPAEACSQHHAGGVARCHWIAARQRKRRRPASGEVGPAAASGDAVARNACC